MPDQLTAEQREQFEKIQARQGVATDPGFESPPPPDPEETIGLRPFKSFTRSDEFRTVINGVATGLLEGQALDKKYTDYRQKEQKRLAQRTREIREAATKEAKEKNFTWPGGIPIAHAADTKVKKLKGEVAANIEKRIPPDRLKTAITSLAGELDKRGFVKGYMDALEDPDVLDAIKDEVSSNIADYHMKGQLYDLFSVMDPDSSAKLKAGINAGIVADTVIRFMPLSPDQWSASTSIAMKTLVKREMEETARAGPSWTMRKKGFDAAADSLDKKRAALEAVYRLDIDDLSKLRRIAGYSNSPINKADIQRVEEFRETVLPHKRPRGYSEFDPVTKAAYDAFGPEWVEVVKSAFRNTDSALVLSHLGVINDGYDPKSGTLKVDPRSPTGFSPLSFVREAGIPAQLAAARMKHGKFAGKQFSNFDDTADTLDQLMEETGLVSAKNQAFVQVRRNQLHLELLAQREDMVASQAMDPAGDRTPQEFQAKEAQTYVTGLKVLAGASRAVGDIWSSTLEAVAATGEIPLVERGTQWAAGLLTNDPAVAKTIDDPVKLLTVIPRSFRALYDAADTYAGLEDQPAEVREKIGRDLAKFKTLEWLEENPTESEIRDKAILNNRAGNPGHATFFPTLRQVGRDTVKAGAGIIDWTVNSPEEIAGFMAAGVPMNRALRQFQQWRTVQKAKSRIRGTMPSLAAYQPATTKGVARHVRDLAAGASGAQQAKRMEQAAAAVRLMVQKLQLGKSVGPGLNNLTATLLSEAAPIAASSGSPAMGFLNAFFHSELAKGIGIPGRVKRLLGAIKGKVPPLKRASAVNVAGRLSKQPVFWAEVNRLGATEAARAVELAKTSPELLARVKSLQSSAEALRASKAPGARAELSRVMAERDKLLGGFSAEAKKYFKSHQADYDVFFTEWSLGKDPSYGPHFQKILKKSGVKPSAADIPGGDIDQFYDWVTSGAQNIIKADAAGAKAWVRTDALYGTYENLLKAQVSDLSKEQRAMRHMLERLGPNEMEAAVAAEIPGKLEKAQKLLARLVEERGTVAARPYYERRTIGRESVLWDLIEKKNPVELVDHMRLFPGIFEGELPLSYVEVLKDGTTQVAKKKISALRRLFEAPGPLPGRGAAERKALQALHGRMRELPGALQASAEAYAPTSFNITHLPVHLRGKALDEASKELQLQEILGQYQNNIFAEAYLKLDTKAQAQLTEAITLRDKTKVAELLKEHPWAHDAVRRLYSGLGKPTPDVARLAENYKEFFDGLIDRSYTAGRITKAQRNFYRDQAIREFETSRLHTQAAATKDKTAQIAAREAKEMTSPGARGLHSDIFGHLRRDENRFALHRMNRDGAALHEEFGSEKELLARVKELYGPKFARRFKSTRWGNKQDGFKVTKNQAGADVVASKPLGAENVADIDFARMPAENMFTNAQEMIDDLALIEKIQVAENMGGYVLSPKEFNRLAGTYTSPAAQAEFKKRFLKPDAHLPGKANLGKYNGFYFERDFLNQVLQGRSAWDKVREVAKVLSFGLSDANVAKGMHEAAKFNRIILNPSTWSGNFLFNIYLDGVAGTGIFNPRRFIRNTRLLGEFKKAHQTGQMHPLEKDLVRHIGRQHGLFETEGNSAVRAAHRRVMGMDDLDGLYKTRDRLKARLKDEGVDDKLNEQLLAQSIATNKRIKELEAGWLRKLGREVGALGHQGKLSTGEPRARAAERLKSAYNYIDAQTRTHAFLNCVLDKGMTPKAAGWYVRTFFQDYERVPQWVRAMSHDPIVGSMVTSFPFEAGRIFANQIRYHPGKMLAMSAMIPAWNMTQFLSSGISWDRFQGFLGRGAGGSWLEQGRSLMTEPKFIDRETGNLTGSVGLANAIYPFVDMFSPTGALGHLFDKVSPPEDRRSLGATAAEMLVGVASKFFLSTPILDAAIEGSEALGGDKEWDERWKAAGRAVFSKFVPPLAPFGTQLSSIADAADAGVGDTGRPYRAKGLGDALVRAMTNVTLRGNFKISRWLGEEADKALHANGFMRFFFGEGPTPKPKDQVDNTEIARFAVYAHMEHRPRVNRYSVDDTLRLLTAKLRFAKSRGDEKRVKQLEAERFKKAGALRKYGRPLTDDEKKKRLKSFDDRTYMDMFRDLDLLQQIKTTILAESQFTPEHRERGTKAFAEAIKYTWRWNETGDESDLEVLGLAKEALRARIIERGGKVENDQAVTSLESYEDLWEYLKKQIATAPMTKAMEEASEAEGDAYRSTWERQ